ncbi:MAG TPA: hypothetical protein VKB84_25840 [Candidatus Binataceae bacterium]|nr:hypothetical protein [Candidatus Binataceae bacterium]
MTALARFPMVPPAILLIDQVIDARNVRVDRLGVLAYGFLHLIGGDVRVAGGLFGGRCRRFGAIGRGVGSRSSELRLLGGFV